MIKVQELAMEQNQRLYRKSKKTRNQSGVFSDEHKNCKACDKQILRLEIEQRMLKNKWILLRAKFSFAVCVINLLLLMGACIYIFINSFYFPQEIRYSVASIVYLSIFAFIGYITNTSSMMRAVASAILNFSFHNKEKKKSRKKL
ncbi:MAG: hypothetical protein LUM44_15770 [Pyrinomonadaceae bacterium]|nr:hypothetical protein [Pyrinomonadaceae bacterium]